MEFYKLLYYRIYTFTRTINKKDPIWGALFIVSAIEWTLIDIFLIVLDILGILDHPLNGRSFGFVVAMIIAINAYIFLSDKTAKKLITKFEKNLQESEAEFDVQLEKTKSFLLYLAIITVITWIIHGNNVINQKGIPYSNSNDNRSSQTNDENYEERDAMDSWIDRNNPDSIRTK